MAQSGDQVDFVLEVRRQHRRLAEKYLQRFGPLFGMVNGLIDDAEAALADLPDDRVVGETRKPAGGELTEVLAALLILLEQFFRLATLIGLNAVVREGLDQFVMGTGLGCLILHANTTYSRPGSKSDIGEERFKTA